MSRVRRYAELFFAAVCAGGQQSSHGGRVAHAGGGDEWGCLRVGGGGGVRVRAVRQEEFEHADVAASGGDEKGCGEGGSGGGEGIWVGVVGEEETGATGAIIEGSKVKGGGEEGWISVKRGQGEEVGESWDVVVEDGGEEGVGGEVGGDVWGVMNEGEEGSGVAGFNGGEEGGFLFGWGRGRESRSGEGVAELVLKRFQGWLGTGVAAV